MLILFNNLIQNSVIFFNYKYKEINFLIFLSILTIQNTIKKLITKINSDVIVDNIENICNYMYICEE